MVVGALPEADRDMQTISVIERGLPGSDAGSAIYSSGPAHQFQPIQSRTKRAAAAASNNRPVQPSRARPHGRRSQRPGGPSRPTARSKPRLSQTTGMSHQGCGGRQARLSGARVGGGPAGGGSEVCIGSGGAGAGSGRTGLLRGGKSSSAGGG